MCHNEIRDIIYTAKWLDCVCHDVVAEPPLKPLTGENVVPATANWQYDARADIHACGFWGRWQSALKGFSPQCTKLPQLQYLCCI